MAEIATNVDFNFSNSSGSAQKATVKTSLNGYNFDGTVKTDGIVVSGNNKGKITIANAEIQAYLENFSITEISEQQDAVSTTKTYTLQDNVSLRLESIILILRGEHVGPQGEFNYDDYIYNWTEVPNNIKYTTNITPYGKQTPQIVDGRIVVIGDIYNEVEIEDVKGEIYSKVYLGGVEKPELNRLPNNGKWLINYSFPTAGVFEEDRGSWQDSKIRTGYTLTDLKAALDLLNINHEGIPNNEDYLMDESGTLSNVLSAAAQKIGYYWYIDPILEKIVWVDSQNVDDYAITKYINSTDEKIISTSYTESAFKQSKVLAFNADLAYNNPPVDQQQSQKKRDLLKHFRRIEFSGKFENVFEYLLGIYYLVWNRGLLNSENFEKIFYYALHVSSTFNSAVEELGYTDKLKLRKTEAETNTNPLALQALKAGNKYPLDIQNAKENKDPSDADEKIAHTVAKQLVTDPDTTTTDDLEDTIDLPRMDFGYPLERSDSPIKKKIINIANPAQDASYILDAIKLFFETGMGGIYISTPISAYRADRIDWKSDDRFKVLGIYRWDTELAQIDELSGLVQAINKFTTKKNYSTVEDLVKTLNPSKTTNKRYFAIALKQVPKQFIPVETQDVKNVFATPRNCDIRFDDKERKWFLTRNGTAIESLIQTSISNFQEDLVNISTDSDITIPYTKRRNPKVDEGDVDDDDDDVPTQINFTALDTNRNKRVFRLEKTTGLDEFNPLSLENYSVNSKLEIDALLASRSQTMSTNFRKSSTRTIYGLEMPSFSPTLSSISISFGNDGTTTSITESNLDILPTDQNIVVDRFKQAKVINSTFTKVSASRKNFLGL